MTTDKDKPKIKTRISITIYPDVRDEVVAFCEENGYSVSEYIEYLVIEAMKTGKKIGKKR